MADQRPPYYILVSHSSPQSTAPGNTKALTHPAIQYHYADDPPLAVLPHSRDEEVLVLDYDPSGLASPHAQTLSGNSVVTGVKVTAPGAAAAGNDFAWSEKMFVLQTTRLDDQPATGEGDPRTILANFKERNVILRQVLDYHSPCEDPQATPIIPSRLH
ncbi:hypothetical protein OF83DRAFT_1098242 [Amylostereum chailletii]|nr:hypothetical protein OF83DRAFT_1098242 [Amylostereum chailletii]